MDRLVALVASDPAAEPQFDLLHRLFAAALLLPQQEEQAPLQVCCASGPQLCAPPRAFAQRERHSAAAPRRFRHRLCLQLLPLQMFIVVQAPPGKASASARGVLLEALLRWGGHPLSLQTVLAAFTAAALRVARVPKPPPPQQQQQPPQQPPSPPPQQQPSSPLTQQRRWQQPCRCSLDTSLGALEQAMASLNGLVADVQLLAAVSAPLFACTHGGAGSASGVSSSGGGPSAAVSVHDQGGSMSALRAYWLDPSRPGLQLIAAADVVWRLAANCPDSTDRLVAAIAAAQAAEGAAARGGAGGRGDDNGSRAGPEEGGAAAVADASEAVPWQQLACTLLLQPRWLAFCGALAANGSAGALQPAAVEATTEVGAAEGGAAAAIVAALSAMLHNDFPKDLAMGSPAVAPEVLAAACWAQPQLRQACLGMLSSEACSAEAAARPEAASWLRQLVGLLDTLGCLAA
jgi:hypothetical protein